MRKFSYTKYINKQQNKKQTPKQEQCPSGSLQWHRAALISTVIKQELKTIQFPTKWQDVSAKQYVKRSDFRLDRLPLTALVFSRALELNRDLKAPIKYDRRMIDLDSAVSMTTNTRSNRNYLDLDMLEVVQRSKQEKQKE